MDSSLILQLYCNIRLFLSFMPEVVTWDFHGLAAVFLLGLRHGLDPDHIAAIDGMCLPMAERGSRWAPWAGSFFALGHGLLVTAVGLGINLGLRWLQLPAALVQWAQWLPVVLLLATGLLNLRQLLHQSPAPGHRAGRAWLHRLGNRNHPLGLMLAGCLFALVFDTATQVAAWGYTASGSGWQALLAGLLFTAGMVLTDTIDSQLLSATMGKLGQAHRMARYRMVLGWLVVFSALGMAAYKSLVLIWPMLELSGRHSLLIGLLLSASVLVIYARAYYQLTVNHTSWPSKT
jgi:nickel/cobalt transporter (NiCoT) family protein